MSAIVRRLKELKNYPSALFGLSIIAFLVILSLYTVITIPYSQATKLWRGADQIWIENPRFARPIFFDWFTPKKLARTIIVDSRNNQAAKIVERHEKDAEIRIILEFEFPYDEFPTEITLFMNTKFSDSNMYGNFYWETPDGRKILLKRGSIKSKDSYEMSQDTALRRRLTGKDAHIGLFSKPSNQDDGAPLKGKYKLIIEALSFNPDDDLDVRLVVYGTVHGIAGTDHLRRDLRVALFWGAPVALIFGLLAAVGTAVLTMLIAATGAWYRGIVDGLIQRITEIRMILPTLIILIMIGMFYSRSIWVILGTVIVLGVFGSGIKIYRAMFLQVREMPYIEAAQAYGSKGSRIIFRYMAPRIIPMLIPTFVIEVPAFVFLEATLAFLGISDPVIPTWGKILYDAQSRGALYMGQYYWVVIPSTLLIITGLGFSMLGFALDRIFNPRLRRM